MDRDEPQEEGAPELSEREQEQADREENLNADTTYEVLRREGEQELSRSSRALALSGLAAGLSMGFSLVAEALLHHYLPAAEWRPLVSKLGYSVGFLIVIMGSQQLFTENTLTPVIPLLANRRKGALLSLGRLWAIVLTTNLAGTFLFAWVLANSAALDAGVHLSIQEIGRRALEPSPGTVLLKAVFAGWLVAIMVWMLPAAQTAHFWVIVVISWLIGVGHFSHIIAGSAQVFYLVGTGELGFGASVSRFILPTLVGNVAGGVALVAVLNHGQVHAGGGKS